MDFCKNIDPIDASKATSETYGDMIVDVEAFKKSWYDVYIYNPENLSLPEILLRDAKLQGKEIKSLAYEEIVIDEKIYWLPLYYVFKEGLISGCPKCKDAPISEMTITDWHNSWRKIIKSDDPCVNND